MNILEIKQVKKTYSTAQGSFDALKGISFNVSQGEILGLLGVNGAGKSTLSGIIATLHPATSGDIAYKGKSIYNDIPKFRRKIGYCPQKQNLNGMLTLKENLIMAGRCYGLYGDQLEQRITELIERFDLKRYSAEKSYLLSGGYKQRFMIARSMIHAPEIIILDEPTVGLDPHIRRSLWQMIKDLKAQGITVILTTHYLDEAEKLSDRVCILDQGEIKLIDTPDRLMSDLKETNLEDAFIKLLQPSYE